MKKENKLLVAAIVLPLLVGAFFSQDEVYKLNTMHLIVLTTLVLVYNIMLFMQRADWEYRRTVLQCSAMSFVAIGLIQGICYLRQIDDISETLKIWLGIALAMVLITAFLLLLKREGGVTENVIMIVIFAGFLLRIFYVVLTQATLYQNDTVAFHPEHQGHLGYIYQVFTHGRLPDIDPTEAYQFYHPPLYYTISAIFLRLFYLLRLLPENSLDWDETLQVLPLAYSMMTLVFVYKIAKQMKISCEGRLIAVCFAGFLPYSIMMSGALNNDSLATLFTVMCIYFTLKWYEKPDMKGILIMALCIGCAMMTKISTGMIAPAMAVLMLQRAWKDRKQWTVYLKQFTYFGLIAFPLGLWHSVYCYIKYRMPFQYAYYLGEDSVQYIGFHDKWSRLFDFERAFEFLAAREDYINDFADYNIPVTLIKYAVFGESRYYQASTLTNILGTALFWVTVALFISMVVLFVIWCFLKDGRLMQKVFMLTGVAVSLLLYVRFCFRYTHVCTMNIRYIMGAYYIGCIMIAVTVSEIHKRIEKKSVTGGRVCKRIAIALPVLYAVAVVVQKAGMEALLF